MCPSSFAAPGDTASASLHRKVSSLASEPMGGEHKTLGNPSTPASTDQCLQGLRSQKKKKNPPAPCHVPIPVARQAGSESKPPEDRIFISEAYVSSSWGMFRCGTEPTYRRTGPIYQTVNTTTLPRYHTTACTGVKLSSILAFLEATRRLSPHMYAIVRHATTQARSIRYP